MERTTLTKYETGVTEPDLIKLEKLCYVLGIDYNTLLNYQNK
ncbi:MAG: helix-turn-helix transcriptional regulator [Ruminococcus sp.]|nr:helix-turn-helix transcriptional regulator [Ruminococcus sp.]